MSLTIKETISLIENSINVSLTFVESLRELAKKNRIAVNVDLIGIEFNLKQNLKRLEEVSKKCKRPKITSVRESRLLKTYGLSQEDFEGLMELQNGVCAICGDKPIQTLFVDHCHKTDKVRGLLCSKCNTGIGMFLDSSDRLLRAIEYLAQNNLDLTKFSCGEPVNILKLLPTPKAPVINEESEKPLFLEILD